MAIRGFWLGLALVAALGLAACSADRSANAVINAEAGSGDNWLGRGGGPDETAFSRLSEIDSSNASRLGLANNAYAVDTSIASYASRFIPRIPSNSSWANRGFPKRWSSRK